MGGLLDVLLAPLRWLVDFFAQLVCWIMTALIGALNLIVAALGALIAAAVALLPDMPEEIPSVPTELTTAAAWINWLFPVSAVAGLLGFLLTAWVLWQAVVILMRWAKATSE
jgi:hypothetical protein